MCRELGLIDPTSTEVDYVAFNGFEEGAGFNHTQSSGYHLPIFFMDIPIFGVLDACAWLFGKTSLSECHVHRETNMG